MKQRADRMSRLKEVAVGEHTGKDAETAVAKITEVPCILQLCRRVEMLYSIALRARNVVSWCLLCGVLFSTCQASVE